MTPLFAIQKLKLLTLVTVCGIVPFSPACLAQAPAHFIKSKIVYDIVSIKPANPDHRGLSIGGTEDTFSGINVTIGLLLQNAYQIRQEYITGIPKTLAVKRFDVVAKVVGAKAEDLHSLNGEDRRMMLRALLEEHFGLKLHESTRVVSSLALIQAKGGPRLTISSTPYTDRPSAAPGSISVGGGRLIGHAISISSLLDSLSGPLGRNLIDRTNLHGLYDIHLEWNPSAEFESASKDPRPSISTAIQEQLGLNLIPTKAEERILVVERLNLPSLN